MGTSSSKVVGQFDGPARIGAPGAPGRPAPVGGEWIPTPSLRRPGDPLSGRTKILMASAIVVLPAGYFFLGDAHRPVRVAVAPPPAIDLPPGELLPVVREAPAPATTATGSATEGAARPEETAPLQPAARGDEAPTDAKLAESVGVAAPPLALPETQTLPERGRLFATGGNDSRCLPSAAVVRQNFPEARPSWTMKAPGHEGIRCWYPAVRSVAEVEAPSANARVTPAESRAEPDVQTAPASWAARLGMEPAEGPFDSRAPQTPQEGGKPLAAASGYDPTCLPSAAAVRQSYPQAWPSWTLRAPGHEGVKCWYAATRTADDDRRNEAAPRKDAAGAPKPPALPVTERPGMPGVLPGSE